MSRYPLFTSILNQLQDSSMQAFDIRQKVVFLQMVLHDNQKKLLVSLSENANLMFDGAKGSMLNEEIRIVNGEGIGSVNVANGRSNTKSNVKQREY